MAGASLEEVKAHVQDAEIELHELRRTTRSLCQILDRMLVLLERGERPDMNWVAETRLTLDNYKRELGTT